MSKLTEQDKRFIIQDIVELREMEEMSFGEIAETINGYDEVKESGEVFTAKMVEHRYYQHRKTTQEVKETVEQPDANHIKGTYEAGTLKEFVENQDIDLDKWHVINQKARTWDGYEVSSNGKSVSKRRNSFGFELVRKSPVAVSPIVQHIHIDAPDFSAFPEAKVAQTGDVTLIIPDPQIGYVAHSELEERKLETMHNRKAMALVIAFIQRYGSRIKKVIFLGDVLDAAELSLRYARKPGEHRTLQLALFEAYFFMAWIRDLLPDAVIKYLEGNHEKRLVDMMLKMAPALFGIQSPRQFINLEADDYVSIPSMLSLETLGIEYIPDYPNGTFWDDGIAYLHGNVAKLSGQTSAKMLNAHTFSTVFGHVHRKELAFKTIWGENHIAKDIFSMSPGGLCNNNGSVPAMKERNNWQLGFGIVSKMAGSKSVPQILSIYDDTVIFDGEVLSAKNVPYEEYLSNFLDHPELHKYFINKTD